MKKYPLAFDRKKFTLIDSELPERIQNGSSLSGYFFPEEKTADSSWRM